MVLLCFGLLWLHESVADSCFFPQYCSSLLHRHYHDPTPYTTTATITRASYAMSIVNVLKYLTVRYREFVIYLRRLGLLFSWETFQYQESVSSVYNILGGGDLQSVNYNIPFFSYRAVPNSELWHRLTSGVSCSKLYPLEDMLPVTQLHILNILFALHWYNII